MTDTPEPNDDPRASRQRILLANAPTIYLLYRLTGSKQTTATLLSGKLGMNIPYKAIASIIKKISRGEIIITPDQLSAAANEDPTTQQLVENNPEILDPTKHVQKTPMMKVMKKNEYLMWPNGPTIELPAEFHWNAATQEVVKNDLTWRGDLPAFWKLHHGG
jgi:hypothetical protein